MAAGEVNPEALSSYKTLLTELYVPLLTAQDALGKANPQQATELLQVGPAAASLSLSLLCGLC